MSADIDKRLHVALALLEERRVLINTEDRQTFRLTSRAERALELALTQPDMQTTYNTMIAHGASAPIARLALLLQFTCMAVEAGWAAEWWERLAESAQSSCESS
ncbi:MAG: hypothetical protein L6Q98_23515 [Anaerolineae bacterium]|nr:hypothetical protein [Anaerolineae bacterium]NUQ06377.1 hypothetical protein [Anaerolineae bacterium]